MSAQRAMGMTPAPSETAMVSRAALNAAAIGSLNQYTAMPTATTGRASSSYQVNLGMSLPRGFAPGCADAGIVSLFAIVA